MNTRPKRKVVSRLKVTDAKTRETTEFFAIVDTDRIAYLVSEMIDKGTRNVEFLDGMFVIVSRPLPAATSAQEVAS